MIQYFKFFTFSEFPIMNQVYGENMNRFIFWIKDFKQEVISLISLRSFVLDWRPATGSVCSVVTQHPSSQAKRTTRRVTEQSLKTSLPELRGLVWGLKGPFNGLLQFVLVSKPERAPVARQGVNLIYFVILPRCPSRQINCKSSTETSEF